MTATHPLMAAGRRRTADVFGRSGAVLSVRLGCTCMKEEEEDVRRTGVPGQRLAKLFAVNTRRKC